MEADPNPKPNPTVKPTVHFLTLRYLSFFGEGWR